MSTNLIFLHFNMVKYLCSVMTIILCKVWLALLFFFFKYLTYK